MEGGRYCMATCGSEEYRNYVAGPPGPQEMVNGSALWEKQEMWQSLTSAGIGRLWAVPAATLSGHLVTGPQGDVTTTQLPFTSLCSHCFPFCSATDCPVPCLRASYSQRNHLN